MRKLFFTFSLLLYFQFSYAQTYVVQVAAFDQKVSLGYFNGLAGVYHTVDHNDIHRYYIGGLKGESDAKAAADIASGLGFNARVVDLDYIREQCSLGCGAPVDIQTLKWIFFDFDKSYLRPRGKSELNKLYKVMSLYPDYIVDLRAHTDAKGSNDYNDALSVRRAESAKKYLINKGISESRIKTSTFGEHSPIAKNELAGGKDTEAGRQFNRRVELHIFDGSGKQLNNLVEEVEIPDFLKG